MHVLWRFFSCPSRLALTWVGHYTPRGHWFAPAFVSGFGLRIKHHLYGLRDTFRLVTGLVVTHAHAAFGIGNHRAAFVVGGSLDQWRKL